MLLSGKSLASQFSCHIFSFYISSHAVQADIKPTLVKNIHLYGSAYQYGGEKKRACKCFLIVDHIKE